MPSETADKFNDKKRLAFMRVLKVTSSRSAQIMMYTFALGAIVAIPGVSLPPALAAIATGLGVEALGSILERIAFGENISDEEIFKQMKRAVDESGIVELLTTSKQTQEQLIRLASWQRHLKYVIESGDREIVQNLAEQYQLISHDISLMREDLQKLATQEQNEEIKRILYRVLYLLEAELAPRSSVIKTSGINPFIVGPVIRSSKHFYGRQSELNFISGRVGAVASQSVSIVGERRIGKSSLMWHVLNQVPFLFPADHQYIFVYLDLSGAASCNNKALMSSLRREFFRKQLPSWPESEDGNLASMCYAFEQFEMHKGLRVVICLDEFEYVNAHPDEFDGLLETLRAEAQLGRITIITASHTSLAALCAQGRIETSPFYNIFTELIVGLLTDDAWEKLIRNSFDKNGISLTSKDETFVFDCAGLHPFFTQMAASLLWEKKTQSILVDHMALEVNFMEQAEPHFEHIWRHCSDKEKQVLREQITSRSIQNKLIRRGLLTNKGAAFSICFARFLHSKQ